MGGRIVSHLALATRATVQGRSGRGRFAAVLNGLLHVCLEVTSAKRIDRKAALGLIIAAALGCTPEPIPSTPNIVILYADDMGYGDLGALNPVSKIPTPHLDELASEGILFTDAHSSSGICTPSRYALLTGRYHWRKFHEIVYPFGPSKLASDRLTLPEMLKQAGYRTAAIGKWHLGWDWDAIRRPGSASDSIAAEDFDWSMSIPDGPLAHGFDYYFGDDVPNFPPYGWIENDRLLVEPTEAYVPSPAPSEGASEGRPGPMVTGWRQDRVMPTLTEKAVEWIAEQKGSGMPFFVYFSWTSPHAPIVPTAAFQKTTQAGGYGDFVHQSDWSAGQILAALDENGFRDDTIVIFTSDNGPESYAYPRIRAFDHRSAGPLRGLKRDLWEGGHRVPLVVRWPGRIERGRVSGALISQIDLLATLASAIGYALPDDAAEDSHYLLPVWRRDSDAGDIREALVHNTRQNHYAIREGRWLLIDAKSGGITKVPRLIDEENGYEPNSNAAALFDLDSDLGQRHNLVTEYPERAAQMRAVLEQIRQQGFSAPRLSQRGL